MEILREDGRLSNREVARRLDVSEGTVRQRLKKLQDAGAIRIGVVTDANRVGFAVSAWVRVSVTPEHVDHALQTFTNLDEVQNVAAMAGYNVLVVLAAVNQLELMRVVNAKIESCRGVSEVDVHHRADDQHNIHEVVVRVPAEPTKKVAVPPVNTHRDDPLFRRDAGRVRAVGVVADDLTVCVEREHHRRFQRQRAEDAFAFDGHRVAARNLLQYTQSAIDLVFLNFVFDRAQPGGP